MSHQKPATRPLCVRCTHVLPTRTSLYVPQESYFTLAAKTRAYFDAVSRMYCRCDGASTGSSSSSSTGGSTDHSTDGSSSGSCQRVGGCVCRLPRWVVKGDDDVYVVPPRLVAASVQWERMGAGEWVPWFQIHM